MARDYITSQQANVARAREPFVRFLNAKRDLKAAEKEMSGARISLKVAVEMGAEALEKDANG